MLPLNKLLDNIVTPLTTCCTSRKATFIKGSFSLFKQIVIKTHKAACYLKKNSMHPFMN